MGVVGFILIIFGLLVMGSGIVGGIAKMAQELRSSAQAAGAVPSEDLPTGFIEAMTKFLEALADAPEWLAITVIGLVLVFVGASMLYRADPRPEPA